jgi:acetolactate synthase-1/2/3 large subunit
VKDVNELAAVLHEAFRRATGRPGPVVVDIPKDVQFATGTYSRPRDVQHKTYQPTVKGDLNKIQGDRADGQCQEAGHLFRRRRHQFRPEASKLLRELVG